MCLSLWLTKLLSAPLSKSIHAYELLRRNVLVITMGSSTASSCLMAKTLPTPPVLAFPTFGHSRLKFPVSPQLQQARLTPVLAAWIICQAGALQKRVVCPIFLQLMQCISRQAPMWWKLHLLNWGRFPAYCLNGIGVARVLLREQQQFVVSWWSPMPVGSSFCFRIFFYYRPLSFSRGQGS